MLKFKYKNKQYVIFFYPCGNYLRVTEKTTNRTREFKYDKNTTIKTFLDVLDLIQF